MSPGPNATGEPEPGTAVIGTEMAAAVAKETRHRQVDRNQSPLLGVSYDAGRGETQMLHLVESRVDLVIRSLATDFASQEPEERDRIRSALEMGDFYTLISYARRMMVLSLRQGDSSSAISGLNALAMIDQERLDWRDLSWAAGLLSFALVSLGEETRDRFGEAAALTEPGTAEILRKFGNSPSADLRGWRFRAVRTTDGLGLISDEGEPYGPTVDLLRLSEAWGKLVEDDGVWRVDEPTIGSRLPKVWLRDGNSDLDTALAALRGCVSVRGYLAGDANSMQSKQMLLTFVAEATSPQAAETIAEAAGPGASEAFVGFGLAHGPVSAVVISRSIVQGVDGLETRDSIERFRPVLQGVLGEA